MALTLLPAPALDTFCNNQSKLYPKIHLIPSCNFRLPSHLPEQCATPPVSVIKGIYTQRRQNHFPPPSQCMGKKLNQHPFIQNGQWKNSHLAIKDFLSSLPRNNSALTGQTLLTCNSNWTGYILTTSLEPELLK